MSRCVLFDIDVTLIDSRKIHVVCFKRAFKKTFGVEGGREEIPESFGLTYYEMIKKLELSYEDFEGLFRYCKNRGIIFMSTPFDIESARFLKDLGVEIFKIPSGEITNYLLLK